MFRAARSPSTVGECQGRVTILFEWDYWRNEHIENLCAEDGRRERGDSRKLEIVHREKVEKCHRKRANPNAAEEHGKVDSKV